MHRKDTGIVKFHFGVQIDVYNQGHRNSNFIQALCPQGEQPIWIPLPKEYHPPSRHRLLQWASAIITTKPDKRETTKSHPYEILIQGHVISFLFFSGHLHQVISIRNQLFCLQYGRLQSPC